MTFDSGNRKRAEKGGAINKSARMNAEHRDAELFKFTAPAIGFFFRFGPAVYNALPSELSLNQ